MTNAGTMVSVFGGSKSDAVSREYAEAYAIGRLLAAAGFVVCTGGYQGTMAAASQGAHEAGGHVVGVTMAQLTSQPNEYLTEVRPTADFYERLQALILHSAGISPCAAGSGLWSK